jgi:hypothetical protein
VDEAEEVDDSAGRTVVVLLKSFRLSLCGLYCMIVLAGKFRIRRKVSRMYPVTPPCELVRFHTEMMSSAYRIEMTAPQISSFNMNCSPAPSKDKEVWKLVAI